MRQAQRNKRRTKKYIAAVVVTAYFFSFCWQPRESMALEAVSLPAADAFPKFSLPAEFGEFDLSLVNPDSSKLQVFYIQDAHTSQAAQENIVRILDFLHRHKKTDRLFIEGASGSLINRYGPEVSRKDLEPLLWQNLFQKSLISGAAKFWLDHQTIPAEGLEEISDYRQNLETYRKVMAHKKDIESFLQTLEVILSQITPKVFSEKKLDFINAWRQAQSCQDLAETYLKTVLDASRQILGLDWNDYKLQRQWPNLIRLERLFLLEDDLEKENILKQSKELELLLRGALPQEMKELRQAVQAFFLQETRTFNPGFTARAWVERMTEEFLRRDMDFGRFGKLWDFLSYLTFRQEIDSHALMDEISKLEALILEKLSAGSSRQQRLIRLWKDFFFLEKALYLELDRAGSQTAESADFPALLQKFKEALPGVRFSEEKLIEELLGDVKVFYDFARRREQTFSQILLKDTGHSERPISLVVVAGGYHRDGLAAVMKDKNIPFSVITPKFSPEEGDNFYTRHMLGDYREKDAAAAPQAAVVPDDVALGLMGRSELRNFREAVRRAIQAIEPPSEMPVTKRSAGADVSLQIPRRTFVVWGTAVLSLALAGLTGCNTFVKQIEEARPWQPEEPEPLWTADSISLGFDDLYDLIAKHSYDVKIAQLKLDIRKVEEELFQELPGGILNGLWNIQIQPSMTDGKFAVTGKIGYEHPSAGQLGIGMISTAGGDLSLIHDFSVALLKLFWRQDKIIAELAREMTRVAIYDLQREIDEQFMKASSLLVAIKSLQDQNSRLNQYRAYLNRALEDAQVRADPKIRLTTQEKVDEIQGEIMKAENELRENTRLIEEKKVELLATFSNSRQDLSKQIQPTIRYEDSTLAWNEQTLNLFQDRATLFGENVPPRNRNLAAAQSARMTAVITQVHQKVERLGQLDLGSLFYFDSFGAEVNNIVPNSALSQPLRDRRRGTKAGVMNISLPLGKPLRAEKEVSALNVRISEEAFKRVRIQTQARIRILFENIKQRRLSAQTHQQKIQGLIETIRFRKDRLKVTHDQRIDLERQKSQEEALLIEDQAAITMMLKELEVLGAMEMFKWDDPASGQARSELRQKNSVWGWKLATAAAILFALGTLLKPWQYWASNDGETALSPKSPQQFVQGASSLGPENTAFQRDLKPSSGSPSAKAPDPASEPNLPKIRKGKTAYEIEGRATSLPFSFGPHGGILIMTQTAGMIESLDPHQLDYKKGEEIQQITNPENKRQIAVYQDEVQRLSARLQTIQSTGRTSEAEEIALQAQLAEATRKLSDALRERDLGRIFMPEEARVVWRRDVDVHPSSGEGAVNGKIPQNAAVEYVSKERFRFKIAIPTEVIATAVLGTAQISINGITATPVSVIREFSYGESTTVLTIEVRLSQPINDPDETFRYNLTFARTDDTLLDSLSASKWMGGTVIREKAVIQAPMLSGRLVWMVEEGDRVSAKQPVARLQLDKVSVQSLGHDLDTSFRILKFLGFVAEAEKGLPAESIIKPAEDKVNAVKVTLQNLANLDSAPDARIRQKTNELSLQLLREMTDYLRLTAQAQADIRNAEGKTSSVPAIIDWKTADDLRRQLKGLEIALGRVEQFFAKAPDTGVISETLGKDGLPSSPGNGIAVVLTPTVIIGNVQSDTVTPRMPSDTKVAEGTEVTIAEPVSGVLFHGSVLKTIPQQSKDHKFQLEGQQSLVVTVEDPRLQFADGQPVRIKLGKWKRSFSSAASSTPEILSLTPVAYHWGEGAAVRGNFAEALANPARSGSGEISIALQSVDPTIRYEAFEDLLELRSSSNEEFSEALRKAAFSDYPDVVRLALAELKHEGRILELYEILTDAQRLGAPKAKTAETAYSFMLDLLADSPEYVRILSEASQTYGRANIERLFFSILAEEEPNSLASQNILSNNFWFVEELVHFSRAFRDAKQVFLADLLYAQAVRLVSMQVLDKDIKPGTVLANLQGQGLFYTYPEGASEGDWIQATLAGAKQYEAKSSWWYDLHPIRPEVVQHAEQTVADYGRLPATITLPDLMRLPRSGARETLPRLEDWDILSERTKLQRVDDLSQKKDYAELARVLGSPSSGNVRGKIIKILLQTPQGMMYLSEVYTKTQNVKLLEEIELGAGGSETFLARMVYFLNAGSQDPEMLNLWNSATETIFNLAVLRLYTRTPDADRRAVLIRTWLSGPLWNYDYGLARLLDAKSPQRTFLLKALEQFAPQAERDILRQEILKAAEAEMQRRALIWAVLFVQENTGNNSLLLTVNGNPTLADALRQILDPAYLSSRPDEWTALKPFDALQKLRQRVKDGKIQNGKKVLDHLDLVEELAYSILDDVLRQHHPTTGFKSALAALLIYIAPLALIVSIIIFYFVRWGMTRLHTIFSIQKTFKWGDDGASHETEYAAVFQELKGLRQEISRGNGSLHGPGNGNGHGRFGGRLEPAAGISRSELRAEQSELEAARERGTKLRKYLESDAVQNLDQAMQILEKPEDLTEDDYEGVLKRLREISRDRDFVFSADLVKDFLEADEDPFLIVERIKVSLAVLAMQRLVIESKKNADQLTDSQKKQRYYHLRSLAQEAAIDLAKRYAVHAITILKSPANYKINIISTAGHDAMGTTWIHIRNFFVKIIINPVRYIFVMATANYFGKKFFMERLRNVIRKEAQVEAGLYPKNIVDQIQAVIGDAFEYEVSFSDEAGNKPEQGFRRLFLRWVLILASAFPATVLLFAPWLGIEVSLVKWILFTSIPLLTIAVHDLALFSGWGKDPYHLRQEAMIKRLLNLGAFLSPEDSRELKTDSFGVGLFVVILPGFLYSAVIWIFSKIARALQATFLERVSRFLEWVTDQMYGLDLFPVGDAAIGYQVEKTLDALKLGTRVHALVIVINSEEMKEPFRRVLERWVRARVPIHFVIGRLPGDGAAFLEGKMHFKNHYHEYQNNVRYPNMPPYEEARIGYLFAARNNQLHERPHAPQDGLAVIPVKTQAGTPLTAIEWALANIYRIAQEELAPRGLSGEIRAPTNNFFVGDFRRHGEITLGGFATPLGEAQAEGLSSIIPSVRGEIAWLIEGKRGAHPAKYLPASKKLTPIEQSIVHAFTGITLFSFPGQTEADREKRRAYEKFIDQAYAIADRLYREAPEHAAPLELVYHLLIPILRSSQGRGVKSFVGDLIEDMTKAHMPEEYIRYYEKFFGVYGSNLDLKFGFAVSEAYPEQADFYHFGRLRHYAKFLERGRSIFAVAPFEAFQGGNATVLLSNVDTDHSQLPSDSVFHNIVGESPVLIPPGFPEGIVVSQVPVLIDGRSHFVTFFGEREDEIEKGEMFGEPGTQFLGRFVDPQGRPFFNASDINTVPLYSVSELPGLSQSDVSLLVQIPGAETNRNGYRITVSDVHGWNQVRRSREWLKQHARFDANRWVGRILPQTSAASAASVSRSELRQTEVLEDPKVTAADTFQARRQARLGTVLDFPVQPVTESILPSKGILLLSALKITQQILNPAISADLELTLLAEIAEQGTNPENIAKRLMRDLGVSEGEAQKAAVLAEILGKTVSRPTEAQNGQVTFLDASTLSDDHLRRAAEKLSNVIFLFSAQESERYHRLSVFLRTSGLEEKLHNFSVLAQDGSSQFINQVLQPGRRNRNLAPNLLALLETVSDRGLPQSDKITFVSGTRDQAGKVQAGYVGRRYVYESDLLENDAESRYQLLMLLFQTPDFYLYQGTSGIQSLREVAGLLIPQIIQAYRSELHVRTMA